MNQTTKLLKIIETIKAAKKIGVFSHMNYDLDTLASLYALSHFLKRIGKEVEMFIDSEISEIDARLFDTTLLSTQPKEYDCLISVDCANADRIGKYAPFFKSHTNTIRFDHHKGLNYDTSLELTNPKYSSCSEIIMEVIEAFGKKPDRREATYLYAGLISDTNFYSNTNVTASTLRNGLKLYEYGADTTFVTELVRTTTLPAKKMEAIMIEKMEKISDDVCISVLNENDYNSAKASASDFSNFASQLLNIDGINIACLIKQRAKDTFSISLRSKCLHNVLGIANALGGGGHINAAGAMLYGKEKDVKAKVISAIKENR